MKTTELQEVAESLLSYPAVSVELAMKLAKQYYGRYAERRGSMVVDVVASAWRNYDRVEKHIVPAFEKSVRTPDLKALAKEIPNIPGLRGGEAVAMQAAAAALLRFAKEKRPATLSDDEKIVKAWAKYAEPFYPKAWPDLASALTGTREIGFRDVQELIDTDLFRLGFPPRNESRSD